MPMSEEDRIWWKDKLKMEDEFYTHKNKERAVSSAQRAKRRIDKNRNIARRDSEFRNRNHGQPRHNGIDTGVFEWISPFDPDRTNDFLVDCINGSPISIKYSS